MESDEDRVKLLQLWEEREVEKVMCRYARAVDTKDWESLRSCFCDMINMDQSSMTGIPEVRIPAELQIALVSTIHSVTNVMHVYSNFVVEIDRANSNRATAFFYCAGRVCAETSPPNTGGPFYHGMSMYEVAFAKEDEQWKIGKIKQDLKWAEGNYHVLTTRQKEAAPLWEKAYSQASIEAAKAFNE